MWPFGDVVTWKIENLMSTLLQHLWPPKLVGWRFRKGVPHPSHQVTMLNYVHIDLLTMWTRNKWKTLYVHFHNTKLGMGWHNVEGLNPPSHMTCWSRSHVTNERSYICSATILMVTKLVMVLIKTLLKKLSFPLRVSSVNVTKSAENCGFGHIYWRNP